MKLTDNEIRDINRYLESGKPLPDTYRFLLFGDKREVELVWNGKTREVCTAILPFQTLEHIDEPRTETKVQEDFFDSRGRQLRGWTNKLIWGDNKLILSSLKAGALRQHAGVFLGAEAAGAEESQEKHEQEAAFGKSFHRSVSVPSSAVPVPLG